MKPSLSDVNCTFCPKILHLFVCVWICRVDNSLYYMASSANENKKLSNTLCFFNWLTGPARRGYPARLGLPAASRKKFFALRAICLSTVKLIRSRWVHTGLVLLRLFIDLD